MGMLVTFLKQHRGTIEFASKQEFRRSVFISLDSASRSARAFDPLTSYGNMAPEIKCVIEGTLISQPTVACFIV